MGDAASPPESSGSEAPHGSTHYLIIHNDETHSAQYVINIALRELVASYRVATELTFAIDRLGKVAIGLRNAQEAERLRLRILSYGPDTRTSTSTGPLTITTASADALGDTPVFACFPDERLLLCEDEIERRRLVIEAAVARREAADREFSRFITGSDDPEEGNYRIHQAAVGCLLAVVLAGLIVFGIFQLH